MRAGDENNSKKDPYKHRKEYEADYRKLFDRFDKEIKEKVSLQQPFPKDLYGKNEMLGRAIANYSMTDSEEIEGLQGKWNVQEGVQDSIINILVDDPNCKLRNKMLYLESLLRWRASGTVQTGSHSDVIRALSNLVCLPQASAAIDLAVSLEVVRKTAQDFILKHVNKCSAELRAVVEARIQDENMDIDSMTSLFEQLLWLGMKVNGNHVEVQQIIQSDNGKKVLSALKPDLIFIDQTLRDKELAQFLSEAGEINRLIVQGILQKFPNYEEKNLIEVKSLYYKEFHQKFNEKLKAKYDLAEFSQKLRTKYDLVFLTQDPRLLGVPFERFKAVVADLLMQPKIDEVLLGEIYRAQYSRFNATHQEEINKLIRDCKSLSYATKQDCFKFAYQTAYTQSDSKKLPWGARMWLRFRALPTLLKLFFPIALLVLPFQKEDYVNSVQDKELYRREDIIENEWVNEKLAMFPSVASAPRMPLLDFVKKKESAISVAHDTIMEGTPLSDRTNDDLEDIAGQASAAQVRVALKQNGQERVALAAVAENSTSTTSNFWWGGLWGKRYAREWESALKQEAPNTSPPRIGVKN